MNTNRIVHPGFWFGKSDIKEAIKLAKEGVGGFCIYFGTKAEVLELTQTLQDNAPHKLIISADYEYGLGRWLKDAPLLPSNISIGAADDTELARKKGLITACQAKALGVDWVLTPDVDLADTPQNPIVNTRSFGKDPVKVTALARAFMTGLQDGGCLNSLKHFPGHGATDTDSHMALPAVNKTLAQLNEHELIPYKELIVKADSIMVAHLLIKDLDAQKPTSFSYKTITQFLRQQMRYKGLIVTDALVMKATGGLNPVDAFTAGADILLCPDDPFKVLKDLKETIESNPELKKRAICSLSDQELMLSKLNSFIPRFCKDPFAPETLSMETALKGIAPLGKEVLLKKGAQAHYLEADTFPLTDFKAKAFLKTLEDSGIKVIPYKAGDKPQTLISTTFSNYAAFSGQINFTAQQKELLNQAVKASKESVLVSFGSPFVNIGIEGLTYFLMAGTQTEPFQQISAKILLGQEKALGKLPV